MTDRSPHDDTARSGTGAAKWLMSLGLGALGIATARRARHIAAVDPELRVPQMMVPMTIAPFTRSILRRAELRAAKPPIPSGVRMSERWLPQPDGRPELRVLVFDRRGSTGIRPAMLWIHGGGYVVGTPEQDIPLIARILDSIDMVIVTVDYRLSPEAPFPGPLDDCHASLTWLAVNAEDLGVDAARIAVDGQSAGGGLAASLVQRAVDQGPVRPIHQLLIYPMLDAATTGRGPARGVGHLIWNASSNHYGWAIYLGRNPTVGGYPAYAVPAEREDLSDMPPTWIGVGTLDLFMEEDLEYARRLEAAGVPCDKIAIDRAYHAFDNLNPDSDATALFYGSMLASLSKALGK